MLGLLIGIPAGVLLYAFLARFCRAVTRPKATYPVGWMLGFALLPPAVLVVTAAVLPSLLLWTAIGMTAVLIGLGCIAFFRWMRADARRCKETEKNGKETSV